MSDRLRFADVESLQDLGTYAARARSVDPDGAVRLQRGGGLLAAWVRVLPGQGLLGEGLVLGLRVMPLAGDDDPPLDVTVPLAAVADRMARRSRTGDVGADLRVPPTTQSESWTALTPPRSGWEPIGTVAVEPLLAAASWGIGEVARGTPPGAGAHAVASLRAHIWGRPLTDAVPDASVPPGTDVPSGTGFAVQALGFAHPGQEAHVHRAGLWTRLTLPGGYVLTR